MKHLLLVLLVMTMNLSLYAQANEFESNFELNMPSLEDMRNGDLIKHRLSDFSNPMDEVSSKLNNQFFISETMNVVDSVNITGLQEHQFQTEAIGSIGKQTYTYDSKGRVILMLQEHWNDSTWANHEKRTYEYDSNGNTTMDSHGYWYNASWLNLKYHYGYNGNGLLISQYRGCTKRIPNPLYGNPNQPRAISIAVDSCRKYSYTYDSNENMTLKFSEMWEDSTWTNSLKTTYTYNNNGDVTLELRKQWQDSTHTNKEHAWINSKKTTYTYDNNGNMILRLFGQWTKSTWRNSTKTTYTYDNNENITMKLVEGLQDSTWGNFTKTTYTYDSNRNRTLTLNERWQNSTWTNYTRNTYTYDSIGNMVLMLYELWNGSTWVTPSSSGHGSALFIFQDAIGNYYSFRGKKVEVFYKEITDINDKSNNNLLNYTLKQNYPNPFNPSTTISYSIVNNGLVQLKIYDILGREVAVLLNKEQPRGNYKIVFNASNLTSGIYFYRLQSGNFTETKKLILLR